MAAPLTARTPDTPDTWHWAITPQQIPFLKAGDPATTAKVYFDNLTKFGKIAHNYLFRKRFFRGYYEDLIQQIFVDLHRYNYENTRRLFTSILNSFNRVVFGRSIYAVSLDETLDGEEGNDATLYTILGKDDKYFVADKEDEKRVLQLLKSQEGNLSEKKLDELAALSFGVSFGNSSGLYRWLYEYCSI
jgi:hypothetical protein